MTKTTPWYKSKTVIFNIVALLGAIATDIANFSSTGGVFTAMAVINIVLRAVTKTPLSWE